MRLVSFDKQASHAKSGLASHNRLYPLSREAILYPLSLILMSNTVIFVENLSKAYQLNAINTGTFSRGTGSLASKMCDKPIFSI
jgi:hypothetical protein